MNWWDLGGDGAGEEDEVVWYSIFHLHRTRIALSVREGGGGFRACDSECEEGRRQEA